MSLRPLSHYSQLPEAELQIMPKPTRENGQFPNAAGGEFNLREYWSVLCKRQAIVLLTLVAVVVLAIIHSFRTVPIYEAVGRIAIYRQGPAAVRLKNTPEDLDDRDPSIDLDTQVKILQSATIASQVIKDLRLDQDPAFGGAPADPGSESTLSSAMDPKRQDALLASFSGGLKVLELPNTRIIELRYDSRDPKLAAKIVNTLAKTYIEQNFKNRYNATMQTSDWLAHQLAELQIKVETSQEKLVQYQRENGIVGLDDKQNVVTAKLTDLNQRLTEAESDRIQREARYRFASSDEATQAPNPFESNGLGLLGKLRAQRSELKVQLAQLTLQFGSSYPKVLELDRQMNALDEDIQTERQREVDKLRADYLAASEREHLLQQAFDRQTQQTNQLNEKSIEFNLLKRDMESSRALYESLVEKLKEAGVMAGLQSSNVQTVDNARTPVRPIVPDIPHNLRMALIFGLFGGIALAFFFEALDNTVRTPEQVQELTALATLGVIPLTQGMRGGKRQVLKGMSEEKHRIPEVLDPLIKPEIQEAYRALCTAILLSSPANPPKVMLVTSSLPQEGKTTTIVNCAVGLSLRKFRVLLIDADMRRPRLHCVFRMPNSTGLSMYLAGHASLDSVIRDVSSVANLSVLTSGPSSPHPAELVGSCRMQELLASCAERYDFVMVDSPPVLSVTEGVLISAMVDTTMVVVRAGQTSKAALRRALNLLSQANARVMGVALNAVDLKREQGYYGEYYYYNRGYYGEEEKQAKAVASD